MWLPTSESELLLAIEEGSFQENVNLEAKRELGVTDKSRDELARDIASFSIFGGVIVIGVEEHHQERKFTLTPQRLAGLAERIEQIASNRLDPPVFVKVLDIPSAANASEGYAAIEIPPSQAAPHMAGGRYYARGDRTRRTLTDAEVHRLHSQRQASEASITHILREEMRRDPFDEATSEQGHFFLVAEPLQGPDDLMRTATRATQSSELSSLLRTAQNYVTATGLRWSPVPSDVSWWGARALGMGASRFPQGDRRRAGELREEQALDIELQEHGGIRVFCGRMTTTLGANPDDARYALDEALLAWTLWLIKCAHQIGTGADHHGAWGFGVAATKLEGVASAEFARNPLSRPDFVYDRDFFERATRATYLEIGSQPGKVADRLVGPLLRGLSTATKHADLLS